MGLRTRRKLAKRIRELRLQLDLTQEQAAKQCQIDYKTYQAYEGKAPPDLRLSTLEKLAKGLRVSLADLLS